MHKNNSIKDLYKTLKLIRRVEEKVIEIYPTDKIKSPVHLSIGQEYISVGVCSALKNSDVVFGTYRSHALYLSKTKDVKGFFAELYGKEGGCSKGRGGSMHLGNKELGVSGTSAIVATHIPNAVGYAYAMKITDKKDVTVVFMGDGATEEGVFSESLNFSELKKLPIIFICENNEFAIHTHRVKRQSAKSIGDVVRAYGIKYEEVSDTNLLLIQEKVKNYRDRFEAGEEGPFFLECKTSRWMEHVGPGEDYSLGHRSIEDVQKWRDQDALIQLRTMLGDLEADPIDYEIEREIIEALNFAETSPYPEPKALFDHLYPVSSNQARIFESKNIKNNAELTVGDSLRSALDQEMQEDKSVLVFGLDVDDPKRILGTTKGLLEKYGSSRVFGTPLSEDAMTGCAIGMALAGLKPVHVHIRMDFLMLAMNQLINIASKMSYTFGGQFSVPLVVRAMIGRSWGQGAQHSQSLYSFFVHTPGLKVVAPSNPYDAKGCMASAIQDGGPVIYVEHRLLNDQKGPVPAERYFNQVGKGRITKSGTDVTLLGISYMQLECIRAAKFLEEVNINAEVIDPIWLSPMDWDLIMESVSKTRKIIIVDNDWLSCGVSAEISAKIYEHFEGIPDLRIRRMGFANVVCPTTPSLEEKYYPGAKEIARIAHGLLFPEVKEWTPKGKESVQSAFKGPF